jgi:PIN domain nuclease of toxin-antitoxin system
MSSYLLDTHTLLWCSDNDDNLSGKVAGIISNTKNVIFVSIISFWEICIKLSIGKLSSKIEIPILERYVLDNDIHILPVKMQHLYLVKDLPLHHRDPFDRLLIAQAKSEGLIVLSRDLNFKHYREIKVLW